MKDSIKKAIWPCFGSSIAVTIVQFFKNSNTMEVADFFSNFVFTYIVTVTIASLCIFLSRLVKKNKQTEQGK